MNWEAIGAIGEGLGAVAVIATVIYVALQIRKNSEAVQGSTEQALMSQEMALYTLLAEHASVYRRGQENMDSLDVDERIVFDQLVSAAMSQLYSAFVQYERGLIPQSVWAAYCAEWPERLNQVGFQCAWREAQKFYPVEFRQALDGLSAKTE